MNIYSGANVLAVTQQQKQQQKQSRQIKQEFKTSMKGKEFTVRKDGKNMQAWDLTGDTDSSSDNGAQIISRAGKRYDTDDENDNVFRPNIEQLSYTFCE